MYGCWAATRNSNDSGTLLAIGPTAGNGTDMATKLYVGNLSFEATEDELRNAFAAIGQVVSCDLIMDRFTNKPRGFAFVQMSTQDEANKAVAELNGKDFMGRALRVNEARPQSDRPRDDFGGGGGGRGGDRGDRGDRGGRRDFGRDSR